LHPRTTRVPVRRELGPDWKFEPDEKPTVDLAKLDADQTNELRPYEVQLVHLLVAFASAVREANAEPVVYCAP